MVPRLMKSMMTLTLITKLSGDHDGEIEEYSRVGTITGSDCFTWKCLRLVRL